MVPRTRSEEGWRKRSAHRRPELLRRLRGGLHKAIKGNRLVGVVDVIVAHVRDSRRVCGGRPAKVRDMQWRRRRWHPYPIHAAGSESDSVCNPGKRWDLLRQRWRWRRGWVHPIDAAGSERSRVCEPAKVWYRRQRQHPGDATGTERGGGIRNPVKVRWWWWRRRRRRRRKHPIEAAGDGIRRRRATNGSAVRFVPGRSRRRRR
jgi:hypothetical protein